LFRLCSTGWNRKLAEAVEKTFENQNAVYHGQLGEQIAGQMLRSLHNFMDESGCDFALRIYSGNMRTEQITTFNKKKFTLFSVPFYLLFRIHELL
jgi:hypothetical protein